MDSIITGIQDLISNPLSTPVGQLIERSTSAEEASENWAMYMEICDVINETSEGPHDAIRAIRKLLWNHVGKNNTVVLYTLTVLETCVKNCGIRFHVLVSQKEFVQELVKVATSPQKTNAVLITDRILGLLQVSMNCIIDQRNFFWNTENKWNEKSLSNKHFHFRKPFRRRWADAFQGVEELKEISRAVQELRDKGVEFPVTDPDLVAPIHTPARSTLPATPEHASRQQYQTQPHYAVSSVHYPSSAPMPPAHAVQPRPPPVSISMMGDEQRAKLRSELDIMNQNCKVMGEMLTELTPGQESTDDWQLLQDLSRTLRQMQHRVVGLIQLVESEDSAGLGEDLQPLQIVQNAELTNELLHANDQANNVLLRFDRFERLRASQVLSSQSATGSSMPAPLSQQARVSAPTDPAICTLIDIGDSSAATGSPQPSVPPSSAPWITSEAVVTGSATAAYGGHEVASVGVEYISSEAYSKHEDDDELLSGLGGTDGSKSAELSQNDTDLDDMDEWERVNASMLTSVGKPSATSSEFDQFLSARAATGDGDDKLIDCTPCAVAGSDSTAQPSSDRSGRTLLVKEEDDKMLLSL